MGFVNYLGVALQVVGVVVSGLGLWTTWREFAAPDNRFFAPVIDPTREVLGAMKARAGTIVRRIFRRPPKDKVIVLTGVSAVAFVGRLGARLGYGDLPNDPQGALAELHRRTQQLMDMLGKDSERFDKEATDREADVHAMRSELAAALRRFEERSQRIAVGGLRPQFVGLFLVVIGLVMQGWPH